MTKIDWEKNNGKYIHEGVLIQVIKNLQKQIDELKGGSK